MESPPQPLPKPQALHDISTDVDGRHSRIMAMFRDSLLSKLAESNPSNSINADHGSLIDRQVHEIFKSFHTPTHPPYALMIQRAVTELREETGSSEEAISDFIRREYDDLPWAHVRIVGLHLRKLCVNGELVCTETGRYKLLADDGNFGATKEMSRKENKKQKSGKKTKNNRDVEESMKVERSEGINGENGLGKENEEQIRLSELQVNGNNEPSRMLEKHDEKIAEQSEVQSIGISKEQSNSGKGLLGKTEQQIQSQFQGIEVTKEHDEAEESHGKVAEMHNTAERLQIGSSEGQIQENQVDNWRSKEKAKGYLLTEKCIQDGKVYHLAEEQKNGVNDALNESLGHQTKVVPQRNMKQLQTQDRAESPVSRLNPEPIETVYSSQPTALDPPANLTSSSQDQLAVPVLEAAPYCMPSTGTELLPAKVQLQVSGNGPSETDLGATSKMSASLSFMNVHELKQPQLWNQGSTTPKVEEDLTIGNPEQQPPKRHRGRLTEVDFPEELLPSLDVGILDGQFQRDTHQGRTPKLPQNAPQFEQQLHPQSQAQILVSLQNLEPDENRSQEQKLQLEMQNPVPKVSNCDPDMPPVAITSAEQRQWQHLQTFQGWTWEIDHEQQSQTFNSQSQTINGQGWTWETDHEQQSRTFNGQGWTWEIDCGQQSQTFNGHGWTWEIDPGSGRGTGRGSGRGRGRPPKLMLNAKQGHLQLQSQPRQSQLFWSPPEQNPEINQSQQQPQSQPCQSQLSERPLEQNPETNQSQVHLQSQPCRGRRLGRPPRPKPELNQSQQQLHSQTVQIRRSERPRRKPEMDRILQQLPSQRNQVQHLGRIPKQDPDFYQSQRQLPSEPAKARRVGRPPKRKPAMNQSEQAAS